MQASARNVNIVNVRITHKTAHVPLLEAVAFKDKETAYKEVSAIAGVEECLLLQTCNRVELYLVSQKGEETAKAAFEYLAQRTPIQIEAASKAIEYSINKEALNHLLRVTSGLESMVIGEDQVINQVWDSYLEAEKTNGAGPVLKQLFNRSVNVGRRVRKETGINKGAVSVGSAAVELAENLLGSLNEKKILVMGAGETGTLVAKAMARRCLSPIFIANRTHERAQRLAEELHGQAVKFDKLGEVLVDSDVVFCCTSAPHYLLTKENVSKFLVSRQNKDTLLVIDLSNPRNVEKGTDELPNVKLYNIDDLHLIAEKNKMERVKSVKDASRIIEEELITIERALKTENVSKIISELLSQTEEIRQRELLKALNMMSDLDEREKKIVDNLTSILLKQTFLPLVENLRQAAAKDDSELIEVALKLIGVKTDQLE
ncbi:MAG: glutamyl-tRNA reductase [Candidatus Bathyarchaeia archaeon]